MKSMKIEPDLTTKHFNLLKKLKLFLDGQRFSSSQEAIASVDVYFANVPAENRCMKCSNIKEGYVENKNILRKKLSLPLSYRKHP